MRRFQTDNSRVYAPPNNFDQMIRFKHDLEKQMYREIVFPKISNRFNASEQQRYVQLSPIQKFKDRSNVINEQQSKRNHYVNLNLRTEASDDNPVYLQSSSYAQSNKHSLYYRCTPAQVIKIPRHVCTYNRLQSYPHITFISNGIDQNEDDDDPVYEQCKKQLESTHETSKVHKKKKEKPKEKKREKREVSHQKLESSLSKKLQNSQKGSVRKPNLKIRRKFRVMVYAVFFTVLLPAYSKSIYKNRLKMLMNDYPHQTSKFFKSEPGTDPKLSKYKRDEQKLWNYFNYVLNLQNMISKSPLSTVLCSKHEIKNIKETLDFLIKMEMDDTQKSVDFTPDYEKQILYHKNLPTILQGCQSIVFKIVNKLLKEIKSGSFFDEIWQTFSLGLTNNEFFSNSHPKLLPKMIESGLIQLHPIKQTLLINSVQTEIILLTYDIFARIYCYKWMSYLFKVKNEGPEHQKYVCTANMYLALLYFICEKMIDDYLKNNKVTQKNIRNKERNKSIRPILPKILKQTRKRDEKMLNTIHMIANPPLKNQITSIVEQNPQFVQKIAGYLKLVGKQLHKKIRFYKKQQLKKVKMAALAQKNLIQNYLYEKQPIKAQK